MGWDILWVEEEEEEEVTCLKTKYYIKCKLFTFSAECTHSSDAPFFDGIKDDFNKKKSRKE